MRKFYLLVMTLLVQFITFSSSAFAQDPPESEYQAAMNSIKDGRDYFITTEVDGVKYYITSQGKLAVFEDEELVDLFHVTKTSGGALYDVGLNIDPGTGSHFSNSILENSVCVLHYGSFRLDGSNNRNDWERQVPYMNESGKIAIRSCNTAYGTSSWADAGRAFWTYEIGEENEPVYDDAGNLVPCYSYEPAYIWTFESPSDFTVISGILDAIYTKYLEYLGDYDGEGMNMCDRDGEAEYGQMRDWETYDKFLELLDLVDEYSIDAELGGLTVEGAEALSAQADSLFQAVLDSEQPYTLRDMGDGYYRIISDLRYESEASESGYVDKVLLAPFDEENMGYGAYGTLKSNYANQIWKLEQHGDSIAIWNVGMEQYISLSESPGADNRMHLTTDVDDASHVVFDYADQDYVEDELKDLFNIRLASGTRHSGDYVHQLGHNKGVDSGKDLVVSFWASTAGKSKYSDDGGASEWYLEPVSEEEVEEILAQFPVIRNHDLLVAQNQKLREQVYEAMVLAKDSIRTNYIASASQLSSPHSDESEGQHLEYLIDNDGSTFWHTSWHSSNNDNKMVYEGNEYHYLQISGMADMVGEVIFYLRERAGADNDRVKSLVILGTDNLKNEDEDWELIADITLENTDAGAENFVPITVEDSYPYIRILVYDTAYKDYSFRTFWHAAEIQFFTQRANPNSQFIQMGEVAENLETVYYENLAVADEDITPEVYQALLDAYNAFLEAGIIDPAELRAALVTYKDATTCVKEGNNPGQWSDMSTVNDFTNLYNEVKAYDEAGNYTDAQIRQYIAMFKAMKKSFLSQANGIETDKWYRIMYPTEEMFDDYGFSKEGGDKCDNLTQEDQQTMWGTFVTAAKLESEKVTEQNEDGEDVEVTYQWLEAIGAEDLRDGDRLFFMNDDAIEDKDASKFRFIEVETAESDEADYTPLFQDVKENMGMALDLCVTAKGKGLITKASQFSSNASYPGNDGQKLETNCLIDNDFSTYWHSDYSKTYCAIPYLQVAFEEPVSGFIQVYVGRRNTSNGHVVRMYVQGSNDAENWTNIGYMETPYVNASTPATSQPIDLGGSYSYLRFSMTNRYGTDGGSNIEFDPFAENLTAADYNTKFTYFHVSEFQIYPVTVNVESAAAQTLLEAYNTANKVLLKDVTAEDLAAAAEGYNAFKDDFNTNVGKAVLPASKDKADPSYVIQNKATGLYVFVGGTSGNQNNIYLRTIPDVSTYKAIGYERSLLSAKTLGGVSFNYLHAGESNRRFCTWSTTDPTTNSGLVICEAEEIGQEPLEDFTFYRDIKPGKINGWTSAVDLTPEIQDGGALYTCLGRFIVEDEGSFLAVKEIQTIKAGEPVFYIFGDTLSYMADEDDAEPMKFTVAANPEFVAQGDTINGLIGCVANHNLAAREIYFSGNHAACAANLADFDKTTYYEGAGAVVLDLDICPLFDTNDDYDFAIFLDEAGDKADGIDAPTALGKISQPGNVYSMDGKLLRTGATLNSLKTMGKGMYILNGVKVLVE